MATNCPLTVNQLPQSLTSTSTMRLRPLSGLPDPSVYIGMDQLSHFLGILPNYLDPACSAQFWDMMCEVCPELMQVIADSRITGLVSFKAVTFTWELISQAFDAEKQDAKGHAHHRHLHLIDQREG